MQKYTDASKSNKENIKFLINNDGHYLPNFIQIVG